MSAELPTEEDVLAILVLHAVLEGAWGKAEWQDFQEASRDMNDRWPPAVREIAMRRRRAPGVTAEAAIADSERRLELERAERCVISMAECWADSRANPGDAVYHLDVAVQWMLSARRALEGK